MTIGWEFPTTSGGSYDGFNDSGIETFRGLPFESLAREVLQNSLDAKNPDKDGPVTVEFEVIKVPRDVFPDVDGLSKAIDGCARENRDDEKVKAFVKNAGKILGAKNIQCLRITDYGTTGLRGEPDDRHGQWFAITKARGLSAQKSDTAGGSYGIGKNAPFTVSDLRTVFYSTRYTENGGTVERAQGKSILMSRQKSDGEYTSGTGFYGAVSKCQPLENQNIPAFLKQKDEGTQILIAGFNGGDNWRKRIIGAVIANFFYAIDKGMLEVLIEDDNKALGIVDAETLQKHFDEENIVEYEDVDGVKDAKIYYEISKERDNARDMELRHLGLSTLWTRVQEGLPKKVAMLRKTGMLITDEQRGLKRWSGVSDFAAVCICESDKGNILLRNMENPQHDAFEPARLGDDQKRGNLALQELSRKVRDIVKELAKPDSEGAVDLDELSEYLPDYDPDESLPGEGDERDLEGSPFYRPKPIKTKLSPLPEDVDSENGDNGDKIRKNGGGRSGDGYNEGGGDGHRKTIPVKIEKVRLLSALNNGRKKTVMFTPLESGEAKVSLKIAGDSFYEHLPISQVDSANVLMSHDGSSATVNLQKGTRMSLTVTLQEPIEDAILVVAVKEQRQKE